MALGQYGFTTSGAPAAKEARIDLRFELMPELWAMVFGNFGHPAFLLIIMGVCKMWRELALDALCRLLRSADHFKASGRDKGTYNGFSSDFASRGHIYSYDQEINMDGQLLIDICLRAPSDIRQRPISLYRWTSIIVQLPDIVGCSKCGTLFCRTPIRQDGFIIGAYNFCSSSCLAVAVGFWADRVPIVGPDDGMDVVGVEGEEGEDEAADED